MAATKNGRITAVLPLKSLHAFKRLARSHGKRPSTYAAEILIEQLPIELEPRSADEVVEIIEAAKPKEVAARLPADTQAAPR
jgi:hypothetical protein